MSIIKRKAMNRKIKIVKRKKIPFTMSNPLVHRKISLMLTSIELVIKLSSHVNGGCTKGSGIEFSVAYEQFFPKIQKVVLLEKKLFFIKHYL